MSPLLDAQRRLVELGRIRLGDKGPRGEPRRLSTFRLTSASEPLLEAAARLYGGTVRQWKDAPSEGYFELVTETAEIDILIPPTLTSYSQFYEAWERGGIVRRCDGRTEAISGEACLCDPDHRLCDVVTRVNVMLPRLPGLGVWRLESNGWNAATTLPTTLDLLAAVGTRTFVPAVLRLEQRTAKRPGPDGKPQTRRFAVPVIDLAMTTGELVAMAVDAAAVAAPSAPQLAPVDRRERVARPALPQAAEPVETEAMPSRVERPAFAPPPDIAPADFAPMEEIVSEALGEQPEPLLRGEFVRLCTDHHVTKSAVLAAHEALGIPTDGTTDEDRGRLWSHLSDGAS